MAKYLGQSSYMFSERELTKGVRMFLNQFFSTKVAQQYASYNGVETRDDGYVVYSSFPKSTLEQSTNELKKIIKQCDDLKINYKRCTPYYVENYLSKGVGKRMSGYIWKIFIPKYFEK